MALAQLLCDLPQRECLLACYLRRFIQQWICQFARCTALVATQQAYQAPGSVGFGPVVQRLVAHLQQVANVRHLVAPVQSQQAQGAAAKVSIVMAGSHLLQCDNLVFAQGFAQ